MLQKVMHDFKGLKLANYYSHFFQKIRYIFIIVGCFFCSSCEKSEFEQVQAEIIAEMEWLYDADPDADFQVAIAQKDYRFMGLYGTTYAIPVVKKACVDIDDIKFIKGTSDVIIGYKHAILMAIAGVYAKHYNTLIFAYQKENNIYTCIVDE